MKIEIAGVVRDEAATAELAKQSFGLVEGGLVPFAVLTEEGGDSVTLSRQPGGWFLERRLGEGYAVAEIPAEQTARLGGWWLKAAEGGTEWTRGLNWNEAEAPKADDDRPASVLGTDKDERFEQPDAAKIRETLCRLERGEIGGLLLKTTFNRTLQAVRNAQGHFELAACDTAGLHPEHITAIAGNLEDAAAPIIALAFGEASWRSAAGLSWTKLGKEGAPAESGSGGGCLGLLVLGAIAAVGAGTVWLA